MWADKGDCDAALEGVVEVGADGSVQVKDAERLRAGLIDTLAYHAVHHSTEELRDYCRWLIRRAAETLEIRTASIHDLYMAMG